MKYLYLKPHLSVTLEFTVSLEEDLTFKKTAAYPQCDVEEGFVILGPPNENKKVRVFNIETMQLVSSSMITVLSGTHVEPTELSRHYNKVGQKNNVVIFLETHI